MKTLSIRQPWAWAILHAGKCVENRSWQTPYRGPVLLHAGKRAYRDYGAACIAIYENSGLMPPAFDELPRGGIVGAAYLSDIRAPQSFDESWHDAGQLGWLLEGAVELPLRALSGLMHLFEVEATRSELARMRRAGLLV